MYDSFRFQYKGVQFVPTLKFGGFLFSWIMIIFDIYYFGFLDKGLKMEPTWTNTKNDNIFIFSPNCMHIFIELLRKIPVRISPR